MCRRILLYLLLQWSILINASTAESYCGKSKLQPISSEPPAPWFLRAQCFPTFWMCWNYDGKCIKPTSLCDGWPDCLHGEDEWNCAEEEDPVCPTGQVKCGLKKVCLSIAKHCDGVKDCPGGEDEAVCPSSVPRKLDCDVGLFSCDGVCKPAFMKCNGNVDCFDRTDEPGPQICESLARVYQVSGIAVTVDRRKYDKLTVKWWMDKLNTSKSIEFLPKLCDVESNACGLASSWTTNMNFELTNANLNITMFPFWRYTLMIIVRIETVEYPPGIFKEVLTAPGEPGRPYDLEIRQTQTHLLLTWERPSYINGHFSRYVVHIEPRLPILIFEPSLPSLTIAIQKNGRRLPAGNYTFWVSAVRRKRLYELNFEGKKSEPVHYVLRNDASALHGGLHVFGLNDTQVSLAWDVTGSLVDNFTVSVISPEFYNMSLYNNVTNKQRITITGLNPGTKYNITVTPVYNGIAGVPGRQTVIINTLGIRPAAVDSIEAHCEGPTSVSLHWNISNHDAVIKYVILFWENDSAQIAETYATSSPKFIGELDPCVTYHFDVFAQTNKFNGSPTHPPLSLTTGMDTTAPPQGVKVLFRSENPMQLVVKWRAVCQVLEQEVNYTINYRELTRINASATEVNVTGGSNTKLQWDVPRSYGAAYAVKVKAAVAGSRYSDIVYFKDPVIPFVDEVVQLPDTLQVQISFTPPNFPQLVLQRGKPKYAIWLSNDATFKDPKVTKKFRTEKHWFKFDEKEFQHGRQYYAAANVEDGLGYMSPMSKALLLNTNLATTVVQLAHVASNTMNIFI